MSFGFSQHSLNNLIGVHPDLIAVMELAIQNTSVDFSIIDGMRTVDQEKINVAKGASQTMNSRHIYGCAVDVAAIIGGKISWENEHYHKIAGAVLSAAKELNIPIIWGGNWISLKDYGHFELSREKYPNNWMLAKQRDSAQGKTSTT